MRDGTKDARCDYFMPFFGEGGGAARGIKSTEALNLVSPFDAIFIQHILYFKFYHVLLVI